MEGGLVVNDPYGFCLVKDLYVGNGGSVATYGPVIAAQEVAFDQRMKYNPALKGGVEAAMDEAEGEFGDDLGQLNFYTWGEVAALSIGFTVTVMDPAEGAECA